MLIFTRFGHSLGVIGHRKSPISPSSAIYAHSILAAGLGWPTAIWRGVKWPMMGRQPSRPRLKHPVIKFDDQLDNQLSCSEEFQGISFFL